jgi:hypothetical protein
MSQLTTQPVAVDSEVAGRLLNAILPSLESAGFTVADGSVSQYGLVIKTPDGYVEIAFNALPVGDPDADCWSDPRWDDPSRWTTEAPFEPSAADWLEYHRMFDELDSAEEMRHWYRQHPLDAFNTERAD